MAKAKTIKEVKEEAPVLKVGGGDTPLPSVSGSVEHIIIRGKLATYEMDINLTGSTFNAYIVDHDGNEYDVDTDITAL